MRLGAAFHRYGAAAHSLESALNNVSRALKLKGQFFCIPTMIMASFETGDGSKQALERVEPADVNLRKMLLLDELGDEIIAGKIDLEEANRKLNDIISRKSYPAPLEVIAHSAIATMATVFFGGSAIDAVTASCLGLIVGIICIACKHSEVIEKFEEFLAAFISAVCASILFIYSPSFSIQLVTLASIIVLIPGLSLTIAMTELATHNLVAGTARLMGAIVSFMKLAFGVLLGYSLIKHFNPLIRYLEVTSPMDENWRWLALLLAPLAFMVIFGGRFRDLPWILISGVAAYLSSRYIAMQFGASAAAFVAALIVGASSNVYARVFKHPAATIELPGLILLVPGSIGFKGLSMLIEKNTLIGINTAFEMFLITIALVGGLLLSNIIVAPRRSL